MQRATTRTRPSSSRRSQRGRKKGCRRRTRLLPPCTRPGTATRGSFARPYAENRPLASRRSSLDRGTPCLGVHTESRRGPLRCRRSEPLGGLGERGNRPDHHVRALEQLEPFDETPLREDTGKLGRKGLLVGRVMTFDEVGATDELAETTPELRLDGRDCEEAVVGGSIDPVAGETAGKRPLRLAVQAVRRETVCVVRHRDRDAPAAARPPALGQSGEDLDDRVQRTAGEIGDRQRREGGRGIGEEAGPTFVIQVVPRAAVTCAEAGDRAVDDAVGHVASGDAEALGDTRAESLEHDVRLRAELARQLWIAFQIPDHGLLAGVQSGVPAGRDLSQRIALRCLDADDACSAFEQLATGEWTGEVAREVRDEDPGKRLHYAPYLD